MTQLWHFTCAHGHEGISTCGLVMPAALLYAMAELPAELAPDWSWLHRIAWYTDQPDGCGSVLDQPPQLITCDRLAYRYAVREPHGMERWGQWARRGHVGKLARIALEHAEGAMPGTWYVSELAVPVTLAPIDGG